VTILLQMFCFLLGMCLAIRIIAALHAIVDLWFMIGKAWTRVARGLLGWPAMYIATAGLLKPVFRTALLWGLTAYAIFYVSLALLFRPCVSMIAKRRRFAPERPAP
jgi:hypothetical protein